jgi:hypothetical protein
MERLEMYKWIYPWQSGSDLQSSFVGRLRIITIGYVVPVWVHDPIWYMEKNEKFSLQDSLTVVVLTTINFSVCQNADQSGREFIIVPIKPEY